MPPVSEGWVSACLLRWQPSTGRSLQQLLDCFARDTRAGPGERGGTYGRGRGVK